jgi:NADPH:quinone reductase-like Zn-dependent oxidoreductase
MRQVWIERAGPPDVLTVREVEEPTPAAGEVRIRVEAAGVNFGDIMGRLGTYPDLPIPCVPGFEVGGRVEAVGEGVDQGWLGRDVLSMLPRGGYADAVCAAASAVLERPAEMSAQEGAAFPVNYLTAHLLVERMGALTPDETVLIHSAGGGVGTAAIQLAHRIGAQIIGCASGHKHDFLKSVGVDHCIDYTEEDFETRVRDITGGRGVELILDPIGGQSFRKSCRCLAPTGRLGIFGMSAVGTGKARNWLGSLRAAWGTRLRFTPPGLMSQSVGVFGVNLGNLGIDPERLRSWLNSLLESYHEGALRPVIGGTFPLEGAADAHRLIESRQNVGKVLLLP